MLCFRSRFPSHEQCEGETAARARTERPRVGAKERLRRSGVSGRHGESERVPCNGDGIEGKNFDTNDDGVQGNEKHLILTMAKKNEKM